MAHVKTDWKRASRDFRRELELALQTQNVSIGFEVWDGTFKGDAHRADDTPDRLRLIGGQWDPLGREYIGQPDAPSVTMRVQRQQLSALVSDAQFLAVFGGERSGKTFVGREIALMTLIGKPGSIVFYLLPKFSKTGFVLGEDSTPEVAEGLLAVLDAQGWIARSNRSEHVWELINGSILRVFSASDKRHEESFLGGECDLAVLEEFREMAPRVFAKLFSRVISRNGRMAIVTSPEAGHMIEEIDRGEWQDRVKFDIHRLSVADNFFIFDDAQKSILATAKSLYDPRAYRRKVLGENIADTGADFYNFDPNVHVRDTLPGIACTELLWCSEDLWLSRDHRWRGQGSIKPDPAARQCKLVGLDFGATIMTALEAIVCIPQRIPLLGATQQLNWKNTTLVCLAEHCKEDTGVIDFVQTVLLKRGLGPDKAAIFCDPSGIARDCVSGESPVQVLRKRFGYRVYCKRGGNPRKPGIDAIRIRLHMNRIAVIRAGCPGLINDLQKVRSLDKGSKEVSRDPMGHRPDALRYLVDNIWPYRDVLTDDSVLPSILEGYNDGATAGA